jgi:hypothetical protein
MNTQRSIGALILLAALFAVRAAGAVEVCTPNETQGAVENTAHGRMCAETAAVLIKLAETSGISCAGIYGSLMDPSKKYYAITCFQPITPIGPQYLNFVSVNGGRFQLSDFQ